MLGSVAHGLEFHRSGWLEAGQLLLLGVGAHWDGTELLTGKFTTLILLYTNYH